MMVHVHKDDAHATPIGTYDMDVVPVVGDEMELAGINYVVVRRRLEPWFEPPITITVWVDKL
jgi:hypothetical protein